MPSLEAVAASAHELVGVVTRPDARAGRGRRSHPSPVRQRAEELDVPVLTPTTVRDEAFLAALRTRGEDGAMIAASTPGRSTG